MLVPNWIDGAPVEAASGERFVKLSPVTEEPLAEVARSRAADVELAVTGALAAFGPWSATPPVQRGRALRALANHLASRREEVARCVHEETGKSMKDALGETDGAVDLGHFFAGEGQRLYGRSMTSGTPNRYPVTMRRPVGVAGLIIAANTPIANVAWKVFPALVCGNTAVLKAAEDTPRTAALFAGIAAEAGLPPGVLQVLQGFGVECGEPLVADTRVGVVSFTGSTAVGRQIGQACAARLAKVSLELGGKNPFVVLADADLDRAVHWGLLSAFSNAGQRCAAASRFVVEAGIYDEFVHRMVEGARGMRLGDQDSDDLGPVINQRALHRLVNAVQASVGHVLCGGCREGHKGFFFQPTLLAEVPLDAPVSCQELFGPVAAVYRAKDADDALRIANATEYGLTATIHTRDIDLGLRLAMQVRAGTVSLNAATYGSEPHWPFGGLGLSGNGTREPGTEALDIYTDLKNVVLNHS